MENEIRTALVRLLEGIGKTDGRAIAEETARLDSLLERGRYGLNPQLVHFLERRSYTKALQFLTGDIAIPSGKCEPRGRKTDA